MLNVYIFGILDKKKIHHFLDRTMNRLFEKIIDSVFIFWSIYIYREENILETLDNMIQLSRTKHTHTQDKMLPYWSNKQVRDKTTYKSLWIYKLIKLLILSS